MEAWDARFAVGILFQRGDLHHTGCGDLVLPKQWRLVGGVEALTGILMCGLSTGLFFAVFAKVFGLNRGGTPTA
jgi:hypothetical protein